jgi:DNA-binding NtrC family response regulator
MQNQYLKLINIPSPILITGPTGSGKSVVARKIFEKSNIHRSQFITLHLASLNEELIETELFGHKKGAYTGAVEAGAGYFKAIGDGTLFLDEIGELSLSAQKKLLFLLEEKKFTPVGSTQNLEFKGRIIMATNKNLFELVKKGEFRSDLYYRINVFHLELEGIRSDKVRLNKSISDIFEEMKKRYGKTFLNLSLEARGELMNRAWPGNYRELKNVLEKAVALCEDVCVGPEQLPPALSDELIEVNGFELVENYSNALEKFEAWYLQKMLEKFDGRVNFSAEKLGISKATLIAKAKKYQINTLKMRSNSKERIVYSLAA